MLYYNEYLNGRRYIRAYDEEKHGAPRIVGKYALLYRGTLSVNAENIFTTETAALASWGKYSWTRVVMPGGGEVTPQRSTSETINRKAFSYCGA